MGRSGSQGAVWWEDAGPEGKRRGKACSEIGKSAHTHLDAHIVYDTRTHTHRAEWSNTKQDNGIYLSRRRAMGVFVLGNM